VAVEITMPRLSDSMEEGTILRWLVTEGDRLEAGQPLAEIETDKATVVYEVESEGTVLALAVGEGAAVPVGAPIAVVGRPGEELPAGPQPGSLAAAGGRPPADADASRADPAGSPARHGGASIGTPVIPHAPSTSPRTASPAPSARQRPRASPLARRLAAELNVDLSTLIGTGPQGRVIRADVERARAGAAEQASAPRPTTLAPSDARKGPVSIHPLDRLQQTVARRMTQSRATVPDFELSCEVDMTAAVELRANLAAVADPSPSYNDFIVKAAALALRDHPRVNAAYHDGTVHCYERINIGVAVATDDALIVPTIFDADRISLGEIARTSRALIARVHNRSITPAELEGGTFTVSNLGMYGVDSFSAVINPPQAAILTVGSLKPRAVVLDDGQLAARSTIRLGLACDHRVLYGADGARFLSRVRELLEHPHALVL